MAKVIQHYVGNKYTAVQVQEEDGKITAEGIAERGKRDRYNRDLGYRIALGRAEKALKLKIERKQLTKYMG